jgi:hypothetical protein
MQGLDKAKKAKPNTFTDETYARARVSCLPANMPDFVRHDDAAGTFNPFLLCTLA